MLKSKETLAEKVKRLEKELEEEKLRNLRLNTMIDVSDKQFDTAIRKKLSSQQSKSSNRTKKELFPLNVDCLRLADKLFIKESNVKKIEPKFYH